MKILQRRQIRIEDPGVRAQVATTLTTVSQYSDLLALYQQDSEISNHLQTLAQNNIAQFAQFSSEVSQLVDTIELRNQHGLAHLEKASARGQYSLLLLGMVSLCALILILWRVVYRSSRVHLPNKRRRCNGCWTVILTPLSRKPLAYGSWIPSGG